MAKSHKQSVLQLANKAGVEIDDALIRLWDGGFNDVSCDEKATDFILILAEPVRPKRIRL